jgi:riboflavin biosynthesis pyrimidine reductase
VKNALALTDSFTEFVRSKEREAIEAGLPRYMTTFDARLADMLAIGNDWTRRLFDGDFYTSPPPDARRPACSLVFVQSADGNTGAANPSHLGGGETDKHLIYEGLSRVSADAVMAGAGTARDGRMVFSVWHPELVGLRASLGKPRHPVQVIATLRGIDIERAMLFNVPEIRVVVLTVRACETLMRKELSSRPWITPIVVDDPRGLPHAFSRLRKMGLERISCIGGRTLATQLLDAGVVQDVYLTTSARGGGEPNTPMYPRPLAGELVVRKAGTGVEAGVVFEHLRVITTNDTKDVLTTDPAGIPS